VGLGFVKEEIINGRHVSEYHNGKTDQPIVFVDGHAVEKSFTQACADCGKEDEGTHAFDA
jgi:hypothetical protein